MRHLAIAILVATLMVISSMALASAASGNPKTGFDYFDTNSNGISNFTVHVNNQIIEVFRYFNISGSSQSLNLPDINENKIIPISWQGFGNVSIIPAVSFSGVGTFNYSSTSMQYVYLYQSDYLGILFTTGHISEYGKQILILAGNTLGENSVIIVNAPLY
ncbi:MAG: hypothetical protein QXU18_09590, partial [Thermoplasmatales archaeon]